MELVRSFISIVGGLPCEKVRSAPAMVVSGPAQRSLMLWPARSPSRHATLYTESSELRCLRRRFDCYRVERTSSRAGVSPAEVQRLSRRTVTSIILTRLAKTITTALCYLSYAGAEVALTTREKHSPDPTVTRQESLWQRDIRRWMIRRLV